ncbi:MAG: TauD/TfdA family dioxygenase, partial [Sphingomonadales bacterium]|nr:TauD/TfdA family dioxygenase [Sphingomonadales bacterium]
MPETPLDALARRVAETPLFSCEALLSGDHAAELQALLLARGVLVWRNLAITPEEQRRITAQFGPLRTGPDDDGLQQVTIDPHQSAEYTAYQANTMLWHMDGYHDQTVPCLGGSFRPIRL